MIRHAALSALTCWALTPSPAHAGELGGASGGVWGDLAVGFGSGGRPYAPGIGWTLGIGGFVGRHDDAFAIGRRWGVGLRVRQDIEPQPARHTLRTAVGLEVQRALDLLVATIHLGGYVGPWLVTTWDDGATVPAGVTARLRGGATWRVHRFVGLHATLDAGIDLDARSPVTVAPAVGLQVGIAWARPTRGDSGASGRR